MSNDIKIALLHSGFGPNLDQFSSKPKLVLFVHNILLLANMRLLEGNNSL